MKLLRLVPSAPILGALCACAALLPGPAPPLDGGPTAAVYAVYLVTHDKHTGIAIRRAAIPAGLWPESRDFPQADYLEVGWGNRDYYYGRNQGLWESLKAALWPAPSVLHVAGIRGALAESFPASEFVELAIPAGGFERLVRYIHDAHERTTDAPAVAPLGPGLYGDSRFYPARESFHLFRTCNVWTARALQSAGLQVRDSITQGGLMTQARAIGKVIRSPER